MSVSDDTKDAITAAGEQSEVTKPPRSVLPGSLLHWILGGSACCLVLVMAFSGGSTKSTKQHEQSFDTGKQDYSAQLAANIAKLKHDVIHIKADSKPVAVLKTQSHQSKQYLARQNQPTSMYSAAPPVVTADMVHQASEQQYSRNFAAHGPNERFANQNTQTSTVTAKHIAHPEQTIASGEFIHAILETAINSDLPGMVRAVISQPVYAYAGDTLLIPAGSRLVGQYSAAILQGQNRIMLIWNRVILPSGISVQINSPNTDTLGRAGQGADHVDTHFLARFGEATLLSVISAGVANTGVSGLNQYNSAAQYRMAIAQSFQHSAQSSLQNTLPIRPTIHIHQGAAINVFVTHDLSFHTVYSNGGFRSVSPIL